MILICPVRPGDVNDELRYAMRSWETNLIMPLELWTVGYRPQWLKPDHHIPGNRFKSMPLAVFDNILQGAKAVADSEGPAEEVIFMNDDFFCLDPSGSVLPIRRDISLAEHVALAPANSGLWWPRSLRLTASWLAEQGFPHPHSFEVHRPLLATAGGMVDALSRWNMEGQDTVPQWRTVYGVLNNIDAYPVSDVKLGRTTTGIGSPWISTSDSTWRIHATSIKKRFQKPSRWEF